MYDIKSLVCVSAPAPVSVIPVCESARPSLVSWSRCLRSAAEPAPVTAHTSPRIHVQRYALLTISIFEINDQGAGGGICEAWNSLHSACQPSLPHTIMTLFSSFGHILNNDYLQFSERDTLASMRTGLLLALGLALLAGTQAQPREVNTAR